MVGWVGGREPSAPRQTRQPTPGGVRSNGTESSVGGAGPAREPEVSSGSVVCGVCGGGRVNPGVGMEMGDPPQGLAGTEEVLTLAEQESARLALKLMLEFCQVVKRKGADGSGAPLSAAAVEAVLREAVIAASQSYNYRHAAVWAENYMFAPEVKAHDAALYDANGRDFAQLCEAKRRERAADRLSPERVEKWVKGAKLTHSRDYGRMCHISTGIRIARPTDFVPISDPLPEMRNLYVEKVSHCVNKLLHIQWLAGTCMLLPTELVQSIVGAHFSYQHWALKAGKACGRCICDTSNCPEGICALNGRGKEGREIMRARLAKQWGRIKHPTLDDLVLMILRLVDRYGAENIILWKSDLAAAFNLMDFHWESALLLCFELTEGMTAVHTTGMFGWTGTPYVFQVITRVLTDLIRPRLQGECQWYVDDGLGVSHRDHRERDMAQVEEVVVGLLGSKALARDKSEWGRSLVMIGWHIDLDTMTVSLSERNMNKSIYSFFCFDVEGKVSLDQLERMASYASRASMLCLPMRSYVTQLHKAKTAYLGSHAVVRDLPALAKCDVQVWRAFLCLLKLDPVNYARPLESFRPRRPTVLLEYDASLEGFGVGVSLWSESAGSYELAAYTRLDVPYATDMDSSKQNEH